MAQAHATVIKVESHLDASNFAHSRATVWSDLDLRQADSVMHRPHLSRTGVRGEHFWAGTRHSSIESRSDASNFAHSRATVKSDLHLMQAVSVMHGRHLSRIGSRGKHLCAGTRHSSAESSFVQATSHINAPQFGRICI